LSVLASPHTVDAPLPAFSPEEIAACVRRVREHVHIVADSTGRTLGLVSGPRPTGNVVGTLPPLYPEWLGGRTFCEAHGVRFPYVAGEMANGIATTQMVIAMARAQMLGFFGAGGLGFAQVEQAVGELAGTLAGTPNWGVNLIHSPSEPELEYRVAKLLLRHGVPCVSASAFLGLTPAVVLCSAAGLTRDADGQITRRTRLFAKISRPEVAERFLFRRLHPTCCDYWWSGESSALRRPNWPHGCRLRRTSRSSPTVAGTPTIGRLARCSPASCSCATH
jgi:trans-AT polyketide synthase/acyltransferase/oxidoreductase domain-containing protein